MSYESRTVVPWTCDMCSGVYKIDRMHCASCDFSICQMCMEHVVVNVTDSCRLPWTAWGSNKTALTAADVTSVVGPHIQHIPPNK